MNTNIKGYLLEDNEISVLYFLNKENHRIINTLQKGDAQVEQYEYLDLNLDDAVNNDLQWYQSEGYNVQIKSILKSYKEIEEIINEWKNL